MSKTSRSANCLKRFAFPSITGFDGERADVAEPEHGGAVRHDGDEIALRGVLVRVLGIALDLEARLGDAGRIGEREVALIVERFGGDDGDLAGPSTCVIVERVLPIVTHADKLMTGVPRCQQRA